MIEVNYYKDFPQYLVLKDISQSLNISRPLYFRIQLTLEQRGRSGHPLSTQLKIRVELWSALRPHRWCSAVVSTTENNSGISGSMQFKPTLFKGPLSSKSHIQVVDSPVGTHVCQTP